MIVKQYEAAGPTKNPKLKAGNAAEQQLAHYLNRAFADHPDLYVLNDLRIVDDQREEWNGKPQVAQMDHLVIHRHGLFIIESKSVKGAVTVRDDGGGDEWKRVYKGRAPHGFPSPITQARLQGDVLRSVLQNNRERLLGKVATGLRTLHRVLHGTDQRGFSTLPMQLVIAISDGGEIKRVNRWKEPSEPFRTYVVKADKVAEKVAEEYEKHARAGRLTGEVDGEYGIWSMKGEEVARVASFLADRHVPGRRGYRGDRGVVVEAGPVEAPAPKGVIFAPPRRGRAETAPAQTAPSGATHGGASGATPGGACRGCGSAELDARWGKFGYYWKCGGCGVNTTIPTVCGSCGEVGRRGEGVRVRKDGPSFLRECDRCGHQEEVWRQG